MITLSNDALTITINELGAELTSVIDNKTGYEFLWQGDSNFWNRQAPVLFPNIGVFKDDTYQYQEKDYTLGRHGFARDKNFVAQNVTANSASFYIKSDEETLAHYPFEFSFQITYILFTNRITVTYEILNTSAVDKMYYNVGGHPGFNVSHTNTKTGRPEFDDISFHFEPSGQYLHIPFYEGGLTERKKAKYTLVDNIPLLHRSFKKDALVYQISEHTEAVLNDPNNEVQIRLKPNRMNFMGIWSPYPAKASFISLEPWAGLSDDVSATGDLTEKYGVFELLPNQIMTHDYTMTFNKGPLD
ncbi:aldose 1-epimerase family protein [Fundicoccus sp. Sow4_D5]|uniref:aldose 1-epimerase family protein n=1 Tax=unclassified Fundicoccus TaxID=2761543 RepID=UPI003F8EF831